MKSFALASVLAVFVSAQGSMSDQDIAGLFDMGEDGMLIAPAPTEDGSAEGDGSDVQETLDWLHDLYNAFCAPA